MPDLEARLQCPVCVGLPMVKLRMAADEPLLLDACKRCGGIWFDRGEVAQLRALHPQALAERLVLREESYRMQCHCCHAGMHRNAPSCPACSWKNIIECPACRLPMQNEEVMDLQLDYCSDCGGVWFDNIELSEIWNARLGRMSETHLADGGSAVSSIEHTSSFLFDVLCYEPGAVVVTGQVILETSAEVAAHAPEVAGAIVEGTGELAGSVFEGIADIISGIFS